MKKGLVFWFTGLSGSGKSTVAEGVCRRLEALGVKTLILDGDDVRTRLHHHLGFSEKDIKENNDLIADLCLANQNQHDVILVPIISPFANSRSKAREAMQCGFYEIYFDADLDSVMKRDVKGLYAKAMRGEIDNLIGFSPTVVYEPPDNPDYVAKTTNVKVSETVDGLLRFILDNLNVE
jgi:adenylyl-sulfate kinase